MGIDKNDNGIEKKDNKKGTRLCRSFFVDYLNAFKTLLASPR